MIRDFYHRYTVDEHTLVAMQNALRRRREAAFQAICWRRWKQPGVLLFALLFHDVGKGAPSERARGRVGASWPTPPWSAFRCRAPEREMVRS